MTKPIGDVKYSEYVETLPEREKEMSLAILTISDSMRGDGFDCLRPLSSEATNQIAFLLEQIAWGDTYAEAVKKIKVSI